MLLVTPLVSSEPALARFKQQRQKLVGTNGIGGSAQGISTALSADGNTAIIGGSDDNNQAGAVWVFTRSNGVWHQQGNKLIGSGSTGDARQGFSVAVSADGNTAIVGGPFDNSNAGAAWIFIRSGGVWTQQGGKLVGAAVGAAGQGTSVGLSADGNTAIIGGPADHSGLGAAWVFIRSNGVWRQQHHKLVGTGASGNANQGGAVALSGDGNTAIVGGRLDNVTLGAAWVFTRSDGVWTQQGGKLVGTGGSSSLQGTSVALSGDGNTAVIGGPNDPFTGATWIFTRSGGVWTQQGSSLVGTGAVGNPNQGRSVALSGDGNTAMVGGPLDNSQAGAVWVFTRSNGVWSQQGNKLVGSNAAGCNSLQGSSVALSADGNTAIEGGLGDQCGLGATWVFVAPPAITGINPNIGPTAGGTTVVITGTNFTGATGVKFGTSAAIPHVKSATKIVARTPAHAAGAVDVTVTTQAGSGVAAGGYTFSDE